MADRKSFLLRVDPAVLDAVQRWANDDLRSLNAQIEFVLRDALRRAGRTARLARPPGDAPPRRVLPDGGPGPTAPSSPAEPGLGEGEDGPDG